jgi:ketosteroid isomerase-like protein
MTKMLFGFIMIATVSLAAQAQPEPGDVQRQVMAAEKARTTALEHSDVAALEKLMADDVTYVHASGKVDTKNTYLAAIRSGQLRYIFWEPKKLHVRVEGDAAVIDGEYIVRVFDRRVQAQAFNLTLLILTMYARRDGRWQQIAWQSTRDVAASPVN